MDVIHMPWLDRMLNVLESSDPTLVGAIGPVLAETRRTITIQDAVGRRTLPKDVIRFQIDGEPPIDGKSVCQRPEDRIHRVRRY